MATAERELAVLSDGEFALFQRLIYRESGIFLSDAKRTLLVARLGRRVRELGLASFGAYHRRAAAGGSELALMLDAITTNETHFFREPRQFDLLADRLCAEWIASAARGDRLRRLRVWSAACSSGEEPYSIAMVLHDRLASQGWDVEIVASDLSTRMVERARSAVWPAEKIAAIPEAYRRRHMLRGFGPEAGRAKVGPAVRAMVRFERINLRDDVYPVNGPFDAIFCRNVLIYFDAESRAHVLARLVERLSPGGHLFLGHAESLTGTATPLRSVMPAVYQAPVELARHHGVRP